MSNKPIQIRTSRKCHGIYHPGPKGRRHEKRRSHKYMRQIGRQLLDDAPTKYPYAYELW